MAMSEETRRRLNRALWMDRAKKAGIIPPGELYGRYRFVFKFQAREMSAVNIFNGLSARDMFVVITSIQVEKPGPGILRAKVAEPGRRGAEGEEEEAGGEAAREHLSRRQRIVSGAEVEEPMEVMLAVEVYKFRKG